MSPFGIFKRKKEEEGEEYVEVVPVQETPEPKIWVRVFSLKDPAEVKTVVDTLREGNVIVFVDISEIRKTKDLVELKKVVNKIKSVVETINGDIVAVGENWLIATPSFVRIYRSR